jgi:RHS repeat-associated protein
MTPPAACAASASCGNRYHFTGKERDAESGNDYFGARYYASSMGRFLSPDWSAKVMPVPYVKLDNPQSLNLYSYVWNNPLSRNDPDGHVVCNGPECDQVKKGLDDGGWRTLSF